MKALSIVLGVLALGSIYWASADNSQATLILEESMRERFMTFVNEFERDYKNSNDLDTRYETFKTNVDLIDSLNADDTVTSLHEVNNFADRTEEEMQVLNGLLGSDKSHIIRKDNSDLVLSASSKDWRDDEHVVTPVKDQGSCGSCWAFSTVGPLEGIVAIKTGQKVDFDFSEQQLVDCSHEDRSAGCRGGEMTGGMQHAMKHFTLYQEEYPYQAKNLVCHEDQEETISSTPLHALGDWSLLKADKDCSNLKKELMLAPVAVGVHADSHWTSYRSGVITKCSSRGINHGVVAVGFGTDSKLGDYIIIKNSLGKRWGEKGYAKIGAKNECGICSEPVTAYLKE